MKLHHFRPKALGTLALLAIVALGAAPASAEGWSVDANHSEVNFSVNHFFTPVTGSFREFDIDLLYDAGDPASSSVDVTIAVSSVDTGNERRDGHLLSPDFFEAANHEEITFESTSVRAGDDGQLIATGPLTIKGVTKEIELVITPLGVQDIPEEMQANMGGLKRVASFRATTTLDRGEFGVGTGSWAATLVVGAEVDIDILVEAHLR